MYFLSTFLQMHMLWVLIRIASTFLYKETDKKYTGCYLKTTELLDCALIGVCVVIRFNMVYFYNHIFNSC